MSEEYGTTAMILAKIGNITPANPGNSPKAAFMHIAPLLTFIFSESITAIAAPAECPTIRSGEKLIFSNKSMEPFTISLRELLFGAGKSENPWPGRSINKISYWLSKNSAVLDQL